MNTDTPEHFTLLDIETRSAEKMRDICCSFNFPAGYFPVFICIHLCSPGHFRETRFQQDQLHKMFDSINLSSPENAIHSILHWKDSQVKTALLHATCKEVRSILQLLLPSKDVDINIFTQLQNMQLLYLNPGFQEQMLNLYNFFIKPYLPV